MDDARRDSLRRAAPAMDEVALLAELLTLADHTPDFAQFAPASRSHQEWLGKLQALIQLWNPGEVPPLRGELFRCTVDFYRRSVSRWADFRYLFGYGIAEGQHSSLGPQELCRSETICRKVHGTEQHASRSSLF
jgi:hypothetical protein